MIGDVHIRQPGTGVLACGVPHLSQFTCLRLNDRVTCEDCRAVARRKRWPDASARP